MFRKLVFLCLCAALFGSAPFWAQVQGCEVPKGMTKDQKLPCVRTASILLDQPTLTAEQLAKGPDFDATVLNPCADSGNGVIPDSPDAARNAKYKDVIEKLKAQVKSWSGGTTRTVSRR